MRIVLVVMIVVGALYLQGCETLEKVGHNLEEADAWFQKNAW